MKFKKYNKENLLIAVANSFSLRNTLSALGLNPSGGNYITIKKAIAFFKIDTSHFTGQGHLRGKSHTYGTRPLKNILVLGKIENTHRLKIRLLKEGLKEKKCECCQISTWQGHDIPLELHHIDGNRENNQLTNLEVLCPNCHALTDNYRGKNKIKNPT
jgi:hypothetical protein